MGTLCVISQYWGLDIAYACPPLFFLLLGHPEAWQNLIMVLVDCSMVVRQPLNVFVWDCNFFLMHVVHFSPSVLFLIQPNFFF